MCRQDRRSGFGMIGGVTPHGVTIAVEGIKSGVGVPGLVEMDAINTLIQQVLDINGVITQAVIGAVGDNGICRFVTDRMSR